MAAMQHAGFLDSAARCAVTHGTEAAAEFADLLVADDEWVRREFDAIVATGRAAPYLLDLHPNRERTGRGGLGTATASRRFNA